ncbi:MAG: hypothetical protein LUF29_08715 [Oscillospiraceae bacterium]|nr:hypothetical protein [Oscillospiraceae bacterium]
MGGTVLDYKAKDIYEQGKKDMAISLHESGVSEDLIAKAANVSVELVRKWLGLSVA